jgi:hypothetical protein
MGLSFRKAINFGPLRLNFSKSGVGVSAGVKGARISSGPRGVYVNLGKGGINYRQKISTAKQKPKPTSTYAEETPISDTFNSDDDRNTFGHEEAIESSRDATLEQINSHSKKLGFTPFVVTALVLFYLALFAWLAAAVGTPELVLSDEEGLELFFLCLFLFIGGIVFAFQVSRYDQYRRTVHLVYELDEVAQKNFSRISYACEWLANSNRIWCMSYAENNWRVAQVSKLLPPNISTDISVWSIRIPNITLTFLPDHLLVWNKMKYESIAYQDVFFRFLPTAPTIMRGGVPPDAELVSRTWLHTRKDGGPDLRYKFNPQLPIVRYGQAILTHRSSSRISLQTSNPQAAKNFCLWMGGEDTTAKNRAGSERYNQHRSETTQNPPAGRTAYETLGLNPNATKKEIIDAYRDLVKKNHPDKVASLDPEFLKLAEYRMKKINEAYRTLIKKHE